MIERGETPGDVIGLVEGGGRGGDQPDAGGDGGERRKQGEGLEGGDGMAAAQRLCGHVQHRQMIGHEKCIEFRGLELLCEARQMSEIEIRIREGARITPCTRVETDGPHEGAEMQFAIICHWTSLSSMFWLARRVAEGFSHRQAFARRDDIPAGGLARQRLFRL